MVYVISQEGIPLMPTEKHGMVRHFLKEGLAKVVRRKPFTIQLLYKSKSYTQPTTFGIVTTINSNLLRLELIVVTLM